MNDIFQVCVAKKIAYFHVNSKHRRKGVRIKGKQNKGSFRALVLDFWCFWPAVSSCISRTSLNKSTFYLIHWEMCKIKTVLDKSTGAAMNQSHTSFISHSYLKSQRTWTMQEQHRMTNLWKKKKRKNGWKLDARFYQKHILCGTK